MVMVALTLQRAATAACPPDCLGGGGSPATDCFVEFGGIPANVDSCGDGAPACDADGVVDGVCTFGLSACLNVADGSRCTPHGLSGLPMVRPTRSPVAQSLAQSLAALDPTRAGCTAPGLAVPLAVTLNGVKRGVARLTVTASAGRQRDRNTLVLTCNPSPLPPSLAHVIRPIFQARCAIPACHNSAPGAIAPALDAPDVYGELVNVPATNVPSLMLVHPGSVHQSYLARKILGKRIPDHTQRMPQGCPAQVPAGGCLSDGEIAAIAAWIQAGAPDN
jgi:hypothetical protein